MKKLLAVVAALMLTASMQAQDAKTRTIEDGGTGPYRAIMVGDETLQTHTIFKPADLSAFGKKNPLPVLVWGNGGCANNPREHINFLNEIASQGFIVIAIGPMSAEGEPWAHGSSTSSQLLDAINWITEQNKDKNSQYYNKIDLKNIAAAGMSCGGLEALDISADKRLKTIMVCNSGLFNSGNRSTAMPGMPMPEKERLNDIKVPVIYILGGPTDIAYENGMDDFRRINHVPTAACNYPVGHGGTYAQPHGGEFSVVATAWLKWHLKGDKEAARLFAGEQCPLSQRDSWTIEKKMIP